MSHSLKGSITICALLMALASCAPRDHAERLGQASFANSCVPAVQAEFEQGILLLHSFEFPQAEEDFRAVESADPRCAIAAWGLALAETERSGAGAKQKILAKGWSELEPWFNRPAGSVREQMYIEAVRSMYEGYRDTKPAVRWDRYLAAMASIRQKYPADINASLFYALGLAGTAGSGSDGLAQRRKALTILLPIFKAHPNNPGAAHYIIHAADTPELASIALPAAREYAAIAPDSPHALHMPSHIFNRLGYWRDSIRANEASAQVALEWMKAGRGGLGDELHALNNLEYAYLQLGDTKDAKAVVGRIGHLNDAHGSDPWIAIDARIYFDIQTHSWQDALAIDSPSESPFNENFDVYWIHSIAEARLHQPAAARVSLEQFRKSSADWTSSHGFADILHLALLEAEAWTLYSQGKAQDGVRELSDAARFEKNHPIYYADVLPRPASEMLGEMFALMGNTRNACSAFRASLLLAPNTFNAVQGQKTCLNVPSVH